MSEDTTDWKAIATALAQRVNNLPRSKRSKEYKRIMAEREKVGAGETATTHNAEVTGVQASSARPVD